MIQVLLCHILMVEHCTQSALKHWAKDINDVEGTQAVFDHRAKMCTLAAQGKWSKDLENI